MRASLARPCRGICLSGRTTISAIAAIGAAAANTAWTPWITSARAPALRWRNRLTDVSWVSAAYFVEQGVRAHTHELVVTPAGERWVP